jgi:hypothetical protein
MPKPQQVNVRVKYTPDQKVEIDFNGFVGEGCFQFAEQLKQVMARKGVRLSNEVVTRKPEADDVLATHRETIHQSNTVIQEE